jgi:hypothetical protein
MNPDEKFDAAIKTVAPRAFDVWRKILVGSEARAYAAERRADDAEHQRAGLMRENAELKRELDNMRRAARRAADQNTSASSRGQHDI